MCIYICILYDVSYEMLSSPFRSLSRKPRLRSGYALAVLLENEDAEELLRLVLEGAEALSLHRDIYNCII